MPRSLLVIPIVALCCNLSQADVTLDKAESKFAKSGDLKVHYKSIGEGKTALVFIHGWCCDHTVWGEQVSAFSGMIRMLFVDLPGYGKSESPKIEYTMDIFAKGIDAVLQDAGVEQAVLAGHSMGTPVVRQFYRLFPNKTKGLIFVDGGLRPMITDKAQIEQFMSLFKEETFKETAPRFLSSMLTESTPPAARKIIESVVGNAKPHVAISSMKNMMNQELYKDDAIKVPSQAIMAKSRFWNDEYKAFVKKLVPDLEYREFDGVGHFLFMEKPKEINAAMMEFLVKVGVTK